MLTRVRLLGEKGKKEETVTKAAIHSPNNGDLAETDGYAGASFGKEIGRPSRSLTVFPIGYNSRKRFAVK